MTNAELRLNTATNWITGKQAVSVMLGEEMALLTPEVARGIAKALVELADELEQATP